MMKAGAIGRLGNVTKLLQRQRRDSQWRMQDFVNGGAFPPFAVEEPTGSEVRGYHPREIFEISRVAIAVEKLPRRRRRKKNAARRRVSRIILASVVNASSRRRRGLTRIIDIVTEILCVRKQTTICHPFARQFFQLDPHKMMCTRDYVC